MTATFPCRRSAMTRSPFLWVRRDSGDLHRPPVFRRLDHRLHVLVLGVVYDAADIEDEAAPRSTASIRSRQ